MMSRGFARRLRRNGDNAGKQERRFVVTRTVSGRIKVIKVIKVKRWDFEARRILSLGV